MNALIVGGASGVGLSVATLLSLREDVEKVVVVDRSPVREEFLTPKMESVLFDLTEENYAVFDRFPETNLLFVTAGFGRLALFEDVQEEEIARYFQVNTIPAMRIIHHFYDQLLGKEDFHCGVMVSIAGFMTSPFFSLYGASKAALKIFIESVNVELEKAGSSNRILNVSPGSIKGTGFYKGETDLSMLKPLSEQIIAHLLAKDDLFIPQYDEVFHTVLERYHADFREEGRHSYDYKAASGRMKKG